MQIKRRKKSSIQTLFGRIEREERGGVFQVFQPRLQKTHTHTTRTCSLSLSLFPPYLHMTTAFASVLRSREREIGVACALENRRIQMNFEIQMER